MTAFCRRHPLLLLGISAVLSALPMTFPALFLLSWFSFAPFFAAFLLEENPRFWRYFGRGLFFGFLYHVFVYFWFCRLYPFEFAGFNAKEGLFVTLLAWFGTSFLHGSLYLLPALGAFVLKKILKSRVFQGFGMILAVLLAEKATEWSQMAFPWVRVSLGQYRAPVLIQFASVFGQLGVDLLILTVNFCLFLALFSEHKKRVLSFALAGGIFAVNLLFGALRCAVIGAVGEETVKVSAVQGCILREDKWEDGSVEDIYSLHADLSIAAAGEDPDLILWAETMLPVDLDLYDFRKEDLKILSAKADADLLIGAFSGSDGGLYNAAFLVTEDSVSEPYCKRRLVPFGERVPYAELFARIFPDLVRINQAEELAAGNSAAVLESGKARLGTLICFESIFPDLARESAKDGADLLIILTNDSWIEDSPAAYQHLAHAVFRSVETGRDTVRCANSGVSAFIDARGKITAELGALRSGVLTGEAAVRNLSTVYLAAGDWFLLVLAGLWCAGAILRERIGHGKKNGSH